ncbi:MAG: efflux RND transporter permease subunit [Dehalococcoidia bacterium]|nr:efflux RND transporter permease subunit [Dehalococcoidia bacterium]MSQ16936.1 efflux RND transporter permease subunit [Dehalococcoidia bacterium]
MNHLIRLALNRRPVTILITFLLLSAGVVAYNRLQRELFPEIEFPNITVTAIYPSANPEAVERDVTEPIEEAITGMDGLKELRSTSYESFSLVLATFEFGEDIEEAKRTIEANLSGVRFPDDVEDPVVSRINSDTFPVLQLTFSGDRDIPSLQHLLYDIIIPRIERFPGVFDVVVVGEVDEQVQVTLDSEKLKDAGISAAQVSSALRDNHASFPAGNIENNGSAFTVRTTHQLGSLSEIRDLVVGYEPDPAGGRPGALLLDRPIRLSQVAEVGVGTANSGNLSRTNGKPSLVLGVLKDPNANTVAVTDGVLELLRQDTGLPPDVEIATLSNDGPEVTKELGSVQHDALIGLALAIIVVFAFLLNLRPGLIRGSLLTLRPTLIIGLTIPLSIFTGVLLLGPANISLNFMSLAGLAVSIGNVVDNSIVVLENIYRHLQKGEDRLEAAYQGTSELGGAIFASTMANIAVFLPLAFIQGLVGSFFTPFALTISFVLLASVLVPLTAVPALAAVFLRPGDFADDEEAKRREFGRDPLLQRWFMPLLRWCLGHKIPTLAIAVASTVGSLGLVFIIPVTLFPSGVPQYLTIDVELPTGTGVGHTFEEVLKIEQALQEFRDQGMVELYHVTVGSASNQFGPGVAGGASHLASVFVVIAEDAPPDIADLLRAVMPRAPGLSVNVAAISNGPPTDALEITVVGSNFTAVSATAKELAASLQEVDGVINVKSDVTDARDEVVVNVDPGAAAEYGLNASTVGQQVKQFIVGTKVAEVDLEGRTLDLVVRGRPDTVDDINQLKDLDIEGPRGRVKLGAISRISIEKGPVSVSHFDSERSASITGDITAADTQAVGAVVQAKIDALNLPPGVDVVSGGIFQQIAEGFEDIFLAIGTGIFLIYLVMIITLGSLRMPVMILTSLPLALVGALGALAITGRTLSLSALMGFLLLVGIVVNNAIVLLTFVEQQRTEGLGVYEALLEAGRVRLRPILMTASVTLIALVPLALSETGDGGLIGAELATVIIGGLLSSTVLTLVVVPAIYAGINVDLPRLFSKLGAALTRRRWGRRAYPLPGAGDGDGD